MANTVWKLLSTLCLVFLVPVSDACTSCDKLLLDDALDRHELALVHVLDMYVPTSTKEHLGWTTRSSILHALRWTVRFRQWGDYFCGSGGVSAAFIRHGMTVGMSLDLSISSHHNILTDDGFALFLISTLQMVRLATVVIGLPCSTFVFLSRGTSKRNRSNQWLGDIDRTDICQANEIAWRVMILLRVLVLRKVQFIVEQPLTSCFFILRMFRRFQCIKPVIRCGLFSLPLTRKFIWLGWYGGPDSVPKPTVLWGCASALLGDNLPSGKPPTRQGRHQIIKSTTEKLVKRGKHMKVVKRIYGIRKAFKATQEYPRAFCDKLAQLGADCAHHRP